MKQDAYTKGIFEMARSNENSNLNTINVVTDKLPNDSEVQVDYNLCQQIYEKPLVDFDKKGLDEFVEEKKNEAKDALISYKRRRLEEKFIRETIEHPKTIRRERHQLIEQLKQI